MSRSIHTTRRAVQELRRTQYSDRGRKAELLKKARRQLRRKRVIKSEVLEQRKRPAPPLAGTPVRAITVEAVNDGPHVRHAASPEDILAVLNALPDAATEGIARIKLHLGKEYAEENHEEWQTDRDPFTGRLGSEIFPGVYSGNILGTYSFPDGLISLYANVYDPANLPLPLPLCELYLRLRALTTLVHEVAHHHDYVRRTGRGRWLACDDTNKEPYAEKMEHCWTHEVVLPYLRRAYPEDAAALQEWVALHGGLMLPLEFFADDPRRTRRDGSQLLRFTACGAFEDWVAELSEQKSRFDSCLAFAWKLHYADQYEFCLRIVDSLLEENPLEIKALLCKADTLVHLERFDEALFRAEKILTLDQANEGAWKTRGDVFESRRDWTGLLDNCARWEAAAGEAIKSAQPEIWLSRAVAYCGLDQRPLMMQCLRNRLAPRRDDSEEAAERSRLFWLKRVLRRAGVPLSELQTYLDEVKS